ncbi:unnamed protein product [Amoebophrya sp. A25]|nr:unnamed protein product [Amoebophrya sp. A25]|eukprot:GSA25T00002373001.1
MTSKAAGGSTSVVDGESEAREVVVIPAGTLLSVERAFALGKNEELVDIVRKRVEKDRDKNLVSRFWALSDGTPESETLASLGEESKKITPDTDSDTSSKLSDIVDTNCHSLQIVDTYQAPMKVSTDTERSGVWLDAAFANHGCLPTVHRVVCDEWLLVRACRDLYEGDELLDSYCELLRPLSVRSRALSLWGFGSGGFRAALERAVLESKTVDSMLSEASRRASADPLSLDAACTEMEAYCVRQLDKFLLAGRGIADSAGAVAFETLWNKEMPRDFRNRFGTKLPFFVSAPKYSPAFVIPAARFMELRYGFAKADGPTEMLQFEFQEELLGLLLGGFANAFRLWAVGLKERSNGITGYAEVADGFDRFVQVLRRILPNSELLCEMLSERLNHRALQYHLQLDLMFDKKASACSASSTTAAQRSQVVREVVETLDCFHRTYCFPETAETVYRVWEKISNKLFSDDTKAQVRAIWLHESAKGKTSASLQRSRFEEISSQIDCLLPPEEEKKLRPKPTRSKFAFDQKPEAAKEARPRRAASFVGGGGGGGAALNQSINQGSVVEVPEEGSDNKENIDISSSAEQILEQQKSSSDAAPKTANESTKLADAGGEPIMRKGSSLLSTTEATLKEGEDYVLEDISGGTAQGKSYRIYLNGLSSCPEVTAHDGGFVRVGKDILGPLSGFQFDSLSVKFSRSKQRLTLCWSE